MTKLEPSTLFFLAPTLRWPTKSADAHPTGAEATKRETADSLSPPTTAAPERAWERRSNGWPSRETTATQQ